jgi:hypothetical protein
VPTRPATSSAVKAPRTVRESKEVNENDMPYSEAPRFAESSGRVALLVVVKNRFSPNPTDTVEGPLQPGREPTLQLNHFVTICRAFASLGVSSATSLPSGP